MKILMKLSINVRNVFTVNLGSPKFNSSTALYKNSQLVRLQIVGILNSLCSIWNILESSISTTVLNIFHTSLKLSCSCYYEPYDVFKIQTFFLIKTCFHRQLHMYNEKCNEIVQ